MQEKRGQSGAEHLERLVAVFCFLLWSKLHNSRFTALGRTGCEVLKGA